MNYLRTTPNFLKSILFLLILVSIFSCGEEEDTMFGSYLLIESGYKNCDPGINYVIDYLTEDGICNHWRDINYCKNGALIINKDSTYLKESFITNTNRNDPSEITIDTFTSTGTFTHRLNQLILSVSPSGYEYEYDIDLEKNLTLVNSRSFLGCDVHDAYAKIVD